MKRCKHWLIQATDRHALGVSASASLLTLQLAVHHGLRTLLVEYNLAQASMDVLFAQQYHLIRYQAGSSSDTQASGWEVLMRFARAGSLTRDMVTASAIALYPRLDLLRISNEDRDMQDEEEVMGYNRATQRVISLLTESYDVILWDLGQRKSVIVPMQMHEQVAGMIHVIPQNNHAWNLDGMDGRDQRSTHVGVQIGLIPMHDQRLTFNVRNLRRRHRSTPMFAIPYDPVLRNRACEGALMTYYLRLKHEAERGRPHPVYSSLAEIASFMMAESGSIPAASWGEGRRWG